MRYFFIFSIGLTIALSANDIDALPSYQGFQGIVNTPNAEVLPEGEFGFLYNNQVDNLSSSDSAFIDDKNQKNYLLNIGLFENLDLNLRYGNGEDEKSGGLYLSDRIINFKYQIPFIPKDIAKVSVGMQDAGGGNRYMTSSYLVTSKEFYNFRTSLGYAKGSERGSLDGAFGGVEYQPLSWLQLSTEYDTREWNVALKGFYNTSIAEQKIKVGAMAKSSIDYNEPYFGFFLYMPFEDATKESIKEIKELPVSNIKELDSLGISNLTSSIKDNTLYISYENTLYGRNDIDALGMVLGIASTSSSASNIVVTIKKANIQYLTIKTNVKEYKAFLKTGNYRPNLLQLSSSNNQNSTIKYSDRFKPLLSLQPAVTIVDGSEYGNLDYSLLLQSELSIRLAKGTLLSTRLNTPISSTQNFEKGEVFDYRERNRGDKTEIDQLLLSQYLQIDMPTPWIHLVQIGQFEKELTGVSYESAISDSSGRHQLMIKVANLKDDIYQYIDWYDNTNKREERLLSYRYYWDSLNSNIKLTGGEFLYGDKGVNITMERYFDDVLLRLELGKTKHDLRGESNIGKLSLSIPIGLQKRLKTPYLDIDGGDFTYHKIKHVVSNHTTSHPKPFHTTEVSNSFTIDNYYLNRGRFQLSYIKQNHSRLRAVFIGI